MTDYRLPDVVEHCDNCNGKGVHPSGKTCGCCNGYGSTERPMTPDEIISYLLDRIDALEGRLTND